VSWRNIDDQTLDDWKTIYQKNSITKTTYGDDCWGIDKKCLAYNWFCKKVLPIVAGSFGTNSKLIFSSYIDLNTPLPVHKDKKPLPEGAKGKHHVSILLPYSVNDNKDDIENGSTRFYNEDKTLKEVVQWKKNSAIWWNSEAFHDSGEFTDSVKSKQYFITHTYV